MKLSKDNVTCPVHYFIALENLLNIMKAVTCMMKFARAERAQISKRKL
jgi:hypothetical protein